MILSKSILFWFKVTSAYWSVREEEGIDAFSGEIVRSHAHTLHVYRGVLSLYEVENFWAYKMKIVNKTGYYCLMKIF